MLGIYGPLGEEILERWLGCKAAEAAGHSAEPDDERMQAHPEDDDEDQLSPENDDKGSYRALHQIFDDPESEEETGNHPFAPTPPASSKSKQPQLGGKTIPKGKPKEVFSIRVSCEISSLRFSCNTCYKRHWACSGSAQSHSVSAPPKTRSLPVTTGESISAGPSTRGRSPLHSTSKPVKRPRSPTPPAVAAQSPQSKKTRTGLRTSSKPSQLTELPSLFLLSAKLLTITSPVAQINEFKDLKAKVHALIEQGAQSQVLLERHTVMFEAVLDNMKVAQGEEGTSPLSILGTAPDADVDELDELTPIEQNSMAPASFNQVALTQASPPAMTDAGPTANGSKPHSSGDRLPRIISAAHSRGLQEDHRSSNGRPSSSKPPAPTISMPYSSAREEGPSYKTIMTSNFRNGPGLINRGEEELEDDARSVPGISALPAPLSPTSTTSIDDRDPEAGYAADASHGPTPFPSSNFKHHHRGGPNSPRSMRQSPMMHVRDSTDMQINNLVQFPASDADDLDEDLDYPVAS
ncbi:hypothetical protein BDP27DRAFT_1324747 [Rhodocollybia butyracea]|uniref:Uncharacterized protein n=1 Tax=Rhodocollybia butyracea TaxID=206335 RepID=A0A9P5PVF4_9AGAR|nr:hypothetical protein BDP27DRAFT_1324747 [Rhodocollybia butyracea]